MNYTFLYAVSVLMIVVGVGLIYYIYRQNNMRLPENTLERASIVLSSLLVVLSGVLFFLTTEVQSGTTFIDDGMPDVKDSELNAPAANFSFRMVRTDEESDLDAYKGQVVLINFWATWCAPCLSELPDLNALQERYRDQGLIVLTISDEMREELIDFEKILPLQTVSAYIDGPEILPQPFRRTIEVRPASFIVDRDGIIREYWVGARNYAALDQLVQPYLTPDLAIVR